MTDHAREDRRKLVVFVAVVSATTAAILAMNARVHGQSIAAVEGAGTPLRAGLERLAANADKCAMTMDASPETERPMRHVNASIVDMPDVLVLGQSDADHMSKAFFKNDVRFYNGFISNTCFAYQYEVFYDLQNAHSSVPKIVLVDVRSGTVLREGTEPLWDSGAANFKWYGHPPFRYGKPDPVPWYRDIPSLLSLAQTEDTFTSLFARFRHAAPSTGDVDAQDTGQQFRCVSLTSNAHMYRWSADGARIYSNERNGALVPEGQLRIGDAVGDRHPNHERLGGLDDILGRMKAAGSRVVVYSPPVHPRSYDDRRQAKMIESSGAAIREITAKYDIDYCDLSLAADRIGCTASDFADEVHVSRHCDERVVHELVSGCAPKVAPLLRPMVAPAVLE